MSLDKYFLTNTSMDLFKSCWTGNTHLALRRDLTTDMSKAGGGGQLPPTPKKNKFGGSEGAAGQWRRAALLPAPHVFRLCDKPELKVDFYSKLGFAALQAFKKKIFRNPNCLQISTKAFFVQHFD